MDPGTNSIKLSIFLIWSLLLSISSQETQILLTPNTIQNAALTKNSPASNHPPLCVYPPPFSMQTLPTTRPPPSASHSSPPPQDTKPEHRVWCVAKPTVPASQMQQALDYACASGADCGAIQVNGVCYQPDTVLAHASYAFNSYWQRNKRAGGTCEFGGAAMLVTADPSYDKCHFIYS